PLGPGRHARRVRARTPACRGRLCQRVGNRCARDARRGARIPRENAMTSPVRSSGSVVRAARTVRRIGACAVLGLSLIATAGSQDVDRTRFGFVDVYVVSREPLAAWQFELSERDGRMQVVGIEGGDNQVFADAPYYDREAVDGGAAD